MKSNKCFIAAETQSRRGVCGWVQGGGTDLCVSAGGPSGDGRCGRTCRSKGSPWRTSPGSALDAGAEAAGCSPLSSPSPRQHLEHAHTHTHEEGKTNGRRVECQPCTHHIITQHILPLCPSFPALSVRTPHKVKRIKRVHGPRCFPPDRTLTVHKLSSETPPHNLLLFFFFYPGCCRRSR